MKVDKKPAEKCTVKLMVSADAAEVAETYKTVVNKYVRNVRIPGFRPGKAPLQIVKQHFGEDITGEVKSACFRKFYPEALKESGVEAINLADVTDMVFTPETGVSFTAVVEVRPEFKLPKYKKLSIDKLDVKVTDEQLNDRVESLRKAYAKYEDAKDGAVVAEGDFVQIDYTGTVGGRPVLEVAPEAKAVAGATGFWLQVEEGRFLPELLEALKGMKVGETKSGVKVKFPKDAAPEPLKGKKAEYELTVKTFRSRILPDDESFVKDAGAESMDKLREDIRAKMLADETRAEENRRQEYAIDLLLKKADFDVPESQVRNETAANLDRFARQAQYSGLDADYVKDQREQILAQAEEQAVRQVRLAYILSGIAKEESIEATDEDVSKRIAEIAEANNKKPEEIRESIEKAGNMDGLKAQLRSEKALKLVIDESK